MYGRNVTLDKPQGSRSLSLKRAETLLVDIFFVHCYKCNTEEYSTVIHLRRHASPLRRVAAACAQCNCSRFVRALRSGCECHHRNQTGHWIFTVDALRVDPAHTPPRGVAVTLAHESSTCGSAQCTRMLVTAVYEPLPEGDDTVGIGYGQLPNTVAEQTTKNPPTTTPQRIEITYGQLQSSATEHTTTNPPTTTSQRIAPPDGYEYYPPLGYFRFHAAPLTWEAARDLCALEGGHLMVLNSMKEVHLLGQLWKKNLHKVYGATWPDFLHMGISDIGHEGLWKTVLGDRLEDTGYTSWRSGQPYGGTSENCGAVEVEAGAGLHDAPCDWVIPFICEQRH